MQEKGIFITFMAFLLVSTVLALNISVNQAIVGQLYINLYQAGQQLEETQKQYVDLQNRYDVLQNDRNQLDLDLQANKMVLGAVRKKFPEIDEMISKGITHKDEQQPT